MSAEARNLVRREPPPFMELVVARSERRSPYLLRVTLTGPGLQAFEPPLPGGSVRLLIPDSPGAELVLPVWDGNAFFHRDGRRPVIRTLTPLRHDPAGGELDVDIVLHGEGPLSAWASAARPGERAAMSGPGRGYSIDPDAAGYLLAGDESAIPAIGQLLEALPANIRTTVVVEIGHPDARIPLAAHGDVDVRWVERPPGAPPGSALVPAVEACDISPDGRAWVAGEAAAVQRIRGHLFGERGLSRSHATVRGYWKHGRGGGGDDDA